MKSRVRIIDGGVGTELQRRGMPMHPDCWCATAHLDKPDILLDIHRDYIEAGANVVSTNTFLGRRQILEQCGFDNFIAVNRKAVALARQARDDSDQTDILVAGSVSTLPRLEHADSMPHGKEAERDFREQVELLVDAGVDVLLVEMLIDSQSAAIMLEVCCNSGVPVWAGLSAMVSGNSDTLMTFRQPGKLKNLTHETFPSLVQTACDFPLEMLGVMHTDLKLMEPALAEVAAQWKGPQLAYAKLGLGVKEGWQFDTEFSFEAYAKQTLGWIENYNAGLVGGCCGSQPQHIRAIRDLL